MSYLEKGQDGHHVGPFRLNQTGIEATSSYGVEDLINLGAYLQPMGSAIQWWYADWYRYLEGKEADRALEMGVKLGYTPGAIKKWSWVAEVFPPERRRANLSYTHHRQVAALSEKEQDRLLELAERKEMSVQTLARHADASRNQMDLLNTDQPGVSEFSDLSDIEIVDTKQAKAEEADDRASQYKNESDSEAFSKYRDETKIVRAAYEQVKAMVEQLIDFSQSNPNGKYLAAPSLKSALHNFKAAIRPGLPHAICGHGGGSGGGADGECGYCYGQGWVNRVRYQSHRPENKI